MARRPKLICPACKCRALKELTDYQKEYTLAALFNKHGGKRVVVEWQCSCGARVATEYSLTAILDHY